MKTKSMTAKIPKQNAQVWYIHQQRRQCFSLTRSWL